jgi:hypothetical protein
MTRQIDAYWPFAGELSLQPFALIPAVLERIISLILTPEGGSGAMTVAA